MKSFALLLFILPCLWLEIPRDELEISSMEGAMMGDFENLEFTGSCGGTERLVAHFEKIEHCEKLQQLKLKGQMSTRYDEPFPFMNFVAGKIEGNQIIPHTEPQTADSTGAFNLIINYQKGDELFIYGLGSSILRAQIR